MPRFLHVTLVIILALIFVFAINRVASAACAQRDIIITGYFEKFGEEPDSYGMVGTEGEAIIELLVNPETGSWTILLTMPNGQSCMRASGDGWTREGLPFRHIVPTPAPREDPA